MLISLEMSSLQTDVPIGILLLKGGPFPLDRLICTRQESRAIMMQNYFARTYGAAMSRKTVNIMDSACLFSYEGRTFRYAESF